MTNIQQALLCASNRLAATSESPRLDAEVLLQFVLQKDRTFLYAYSDFNLDLALVEAFNSLVTKRQQGHPIAYLVGAREFWSLPLFVNEHTLIPRPATEKLVETCLKLLDSKKALRILELGTGSGAISLALKSERPNWQIVATDLNPTTLEVAEKNAARLKIDGIQFLLSDWFDSLEGLGAFDAIVSNPPYIAASDPHLSRGDLRFEPQAALASGRDGLDAISEIIFKAKQYLTTEGLLFIEHGYLQKEAIASILKQTAYKNIHCVKDDDGQFRLSYAKK